MQSIWSESWKSSEFITTKIAFTSRSVAALQENDLANRCPAMPSLTTTLGGTIAAVCFRCQSQRNYEFAMDRLLGRFFGVWGACCQVIISSRRAVAGLRGVRMVGLCAPAVRARSVSVRGLEIHEV